MKYLVNLACNGHWGVSSSFSNGQHGFEVIAESMEEAKRKVIERAKSDGFYNAENVWTADILRLLPSGRIDSGLDLFEIYSKDRNQTIKLSD